MTTADLTGTSSRTTLIATGTTEVNMDLKATTARAIIVIMEIKELIRVTMETITQATTKNQQTMSTKLLNNNFS